MGPVPEAVWWEGVIQEGSGWAEPQEGSFKKQIRDLYKKQAQHQGTANRLQKHILKNFTPEKMYSEFCEAFAGEQSLDIDAWLTELESGVEEHE